MTLTDKVLNLDKNSFRTRRQVSTFSVECAQRQGQITSLAFTCLGGRDLAIAFLNAPNAKLGGRPLALATADWAGYLQVEQAMRAYAALDRRPQRSK